MRTQRMGDVTAIRDGAEIPGLGALPVNAFVVHAEQPVLVDTGMPVSREAFLEALGSVIDPADIAYVWITHPDRDHMGALFDVLELAPEARLVTTFMAAGYMTTEFDVPMHRLHLVNPGQALDVGDRRLHALRPPLFDSPMTVGFVDDATGTFVSSDCFGAPLPTLDLAGVDDVRDVDAAVVRQSQLLWAGADSPWVVMADRAKFAASYDALRRFNPSNVLSTHLPPAPSSFGTFLGFLDEAPDAEVFVGPDQAALDAMMAQVMGVPEQGGTKEPVA